MVGNYSATTGTLGIAATSNSDNSVVCGNILKDQGAAKFSISIPAGADNWVIASNRVDDLGTSNGIEDGSGTATVEANNETAF